MVFRFIWSHRRARQTPDRSRWPDRDRQLSVSDIGLLVEDAPMADLGDLGPETQDALAIFPCPCSTGRMLVIVSDTHGTDSHRLTGRTLEAVREADLVIHSGDFCEVPVLDAFEAVSETLMGVYGNNDGDAIRSRLPSSRVVEYGGARIAVCHRRRGGRQALSLFGREHDADAVVFGHSHKPGVDDSGPIPLINPGSHAQPRGNEPAHAELETGPGEITGQILTPDGSQLHSFSVPVEQFSQ